MAHSGVKVTINEEILIDSPKCPHGKFYAKNMYMLYFRVIHKYIGKHCPIRPTWILMGFVARHKLQNVAQYIQLL